MFQDRDIIIEKYQIYQRYSYQYKEKIDEITELQVKNDQIVLTTTSFRS